MKKVVLEDVEHAGHIMDAATIRRPLSNALDTDNFAVVYYELEPGDSFAGVLHRHHDQEEVFYVLSGIATFDTLDKSVTVAAGEAIRFAPGEFQHGYNDADERVVALALAAPKSAHEWEEMEWLLQCRGCEEKTVHDVRPRDDRTVVATCHCCGDAQLVK